MLLRCLKTYFEAALLFLATASLAWGSEFALRCRIEQTRMRATVAFLQQRQQACVALRWRWEADDQEHQYFGSSAGTRTTVGPISGFVMDVTENEYGHAIGECHKQNASYADLVSTESRR